MDFYVALTDMDWFQFLASRPELDELNFWTPRPWGGEFRVLQPGEPFLFKLHAPMRALAGGGFFAHYTEYPVELAWDVFLEKNGADSLADLRRRTGRLRREPTATAGNFMIGCIILSEPFFWPEDLWIQEPEEWSRNIVRGKTYSADEPAGARLWSEVEARLGARSISESLIAEVQAGYYTGGPALRRIGQGTFRALVTDAYSRRCCISGEKALPALDAAHIRPFSETQSHSVQNGILLRSDIHRVFDTGYVTITADHHVETSQRVKEDFDDGDTYLRLHGSKIELPQRTEWQPDQEALRWHNENVFLG